MSYGYDGGEEEYVPTPEELAALDRASSWSVLGIELTPLRMGFLVGAGALILVIVLSLVQLRPRLRETQEVRTDVDDKSRQLELANQAIASLQGIESRIGRAREVNAAISDLLPAPENVETQLLELNRLVTQSNLQLQSFIPGPFEPAGDDVPIEIQSQLRRSRTAVIVDSASYAQGIELMNSIERLETLFRVSDLQMTIDPETNIQTTEFNLDAFIFDSSAPVFVPEADVLEEES